MTRLSAIRFAATNNGQRLSLRTLFITLLESCCGKLPLEKPYLICGEANENDGVGEDAQRYRLLFDLASHVAMNILSSLSVEVDEEKAVIEKFSVC
jgi:hypothetical protein